MAMNIHERFRGRFHAALVIATALVACTTPARAPTPGPSAEVNVEDLVLVEPEIFELGLPDDFFVRDGRALESAPSVRSCHTQGMTIGGDDLLVSCILFDPGQPENRTRLGKSFILRAPLCQITGCGGAAPGPVRWAVQEITEPVPEADSQRITRRLLGKQELSPEEAAVRHLMTHPSGLEYDPAAGGVWVANATYAPDTYAHLFLLDPRQMAAQPAGGVRVPNHIGTVMSIGRFVLGWSWASRQVVVADTARAGAEDSYVLLPHPRLDSGDHVDLQDCSRWSDTRVLCGGVYSFEASPDAPDVPLPKHHGMDKHALVHVRIGRVQILDIDVTRYPDVELRVAGYLRARLPGRGEAGRDLGVRRYRYDESGEQVPLVDNDYGGYISQRPLTYEGMALDRDHRYIYFLPDDLPAGKLIRMRLDRP